MTKGELEKEQEWFKEIEEAMERGEQIDDFEDKEIEELWNSMFWWLIDKEQREKGE